MLLDEVTMHLYPSKYPIIVMVMLDMLCGEAKGVLLELPRCKTFILKLVLLDIIEK